MDTKSFCNEYIIPKQYYDLMTQLKLEFAPSADDAKNINDDNDDEDEIDEYELYSTFHDLPEYHSKKALVYLEKENIKPIKGDIITFEDSLFKLIFNGESFCGLEFDDNLRQLPNYEFYTLSYNDELKTTFPLNYWSNVFGYSLIYIHVNKLRKEAEGFKVGSTNYDYNDKYVLEGANEQEIIYTHSALKLNIKYITFQHDNIEYSLMIHNSDYILEPEDDRMLVEVIDRDKIGNADNIPGILLLHIPVYHHYG